MEGLIKKLAAILTAAIIASDAVVINQDATVEEQYNSISQEVEIYNTYAPQMEAILDEGYQFIQDTYFSEYQYHNEVSNDSIETIIDDIDNEENIVEE